MDENTWVKFPATIHLLRLGYKYVSYRKSIDDGVVDHDTKIFTDIFKKTISKINGVNYSDEEISSILSKINQTLKNNDLGESFYNWLINPGDKPMLVDFDHPENNEYSVVNELIFGDEFKGSFRPDINILINGIPLAFLEVKPMNNEGGIQVEFDRMVNQRYKKENLAKFFHMIQITCFSNDMEYENNVDIKKPRAGSFYSTPDGVSTTFNFFREELNEDVNFIDVDEDTIRYILNDNKYSPNEVINDEFVTKLDPFTPCHKFCTSIFKKERFLFLLKYGILYVKKNKDGVITTHKHIMRYPQFFASVALIRKLELGEKNGIIWHTQGSGKTELTIYLNKILKDYYIKRGINAYFYFVVDRLDLLEQAKDEYSFRGYDVQTANSRSTFLGYLNEPLKQDNKSGSNKSCTIVNIQKFTESLPNVQNAYNANFQRIIFVDEAHRGYAKETGEFYKNLMLVDRDAVIIALTGTPLLRSVSRTNKRFGGYIHKYFYDKSILDGYTLKIKKEQIETFAKAKILKDIGSVTVDGKISANLLDKDIYVDSVCPYIEKDFKKFRNEVNDPTVGGMIVCNSNPQAEKVQNWFNVHSDLNTKLIISNPTNENDLADSTENQKIFKDAHGGIDLLIVHYMLTTGYDADRLKMLYLLRAPKDHALLQTISRVNRPYTSENGFAYEYGYICDFADIDKEYKRAIDDYSKELLGDLIEDGDGCLPTDVFVNELDIDQDYKQAINRLQEIASIGNKAEFQNFVTNINDHDKLLEIQKLLNKIEDCRREYRLSYQDDKAFEIERLGIKDLIKIVNNRIDFLRIKDEPIDLMSYYSGEDVAQLTFDFIKTKVSVLNITVDSDLLSKANDKVKNDIEVLAFEVSQFTNKEDKRIIELNEFIHDLFNKLNFIDVSELEYFDKDLIKAIDLAHEINADTLKLNSAFDGETAYTLAYQEILSNEAFLRTNPDKENELFEAFEEIQKSINSLKLKHRKLLKNHSSFSTSIKKNVATSLYSKGLYEKLNLDDWLDSIIDSIYDHLMI